MWQRIAKSCKCCRLITILFANCCWLSSVFSIRNDWLALHGIFPPVRRRRRVSTNSQTNTRCNNISLRTVDGQWFNWVKSNFRTKYYFYFVCASMFSNFFGTVASSILREMFTVTLSRVYYWACSRWTKNWRHGYPRKNNDCLSAKAQVNIHVREHRIFQHGFGVSQRKPSAALRT